MKKSSLRRLFAVLLLIGGMLLSASAVAVKNPNSRGPVEYYVTVDQTNQIVTVYRLSDKAIVRQMLCSAGIEGRTPNGTYKMPSSDNSMDRTDWYHFTGFQVYAKYPTRIFKGVLFHSLTYNRKDEKSIAKSAIEEYGSAASHGCIRLLTEDAKWIQDHCPIGTKVTIYESGIRDENLRQLLFQEKYTIDSGLSYEDYLGGTITRYSNQDDVAKLQSRLHELGFYAGNPTGVWDADTDTAVLYAQLAVGAEITGNVDAGFMQKINASDAPVVIGYDFAKCVHEPGVRLLQTNLRTLGLYRGEADGIFDFDVSEAAAVFESVYGYEADGTPSKIVQEAIQYEADRVKAACGEDATAEVVTERVDIVTVDFDKSIRLRAKPDTNSSELASVKPGTKMLLVEMRDEWSKVQYKNMTGFMKTKYLKEGSYEVNSIRYKGSSGSYTIGRTLEQAQKGEKEPAAAFEKYYSELLAKRKSALKAAKESASQAQTSYSVDVKYVNTGDDRAVLNVRENPDRDAPVLQALENGSEVTVLSRTGEWAGINAGGVRGYVLSQYLSETAADTAALMSAPHSKAVVSTSEGFAYVYANPSKRAEKIGYVTYGSEVEAYGSGGGFTYIQYRDRKKNICYGFVKEDTLVR